MKEVLIEARKKLDRLNKSDATKKANKEKRETAKKEAEDKKTIKDATVRAKEIFNSIPELIEAAIKERKSVVELYGFNVDHARNSWGYSVGLYNSTIVDRLKKLLNKEKIEFKYDSFENNDEGWYGSDSFGNPSYWTEYSLTINI